MDFHFHLQLIKPVRLLLQDTGFSSSSLGLPLIASRIYRNLLSEARSMSQSCPHGDGQYTV